MKLEMFNTFGDAFGYLKKNWKSYLSVTLVLLLLNGIVLGGYLWFILSSKPVVTTFDYTFQIAMFVLPIIMMFLSVVSIFIRNVYIKITDDVYENRDASIGEQWSYTLKRSGRVLVSILIYQVPIFLVSLLNQFYVLEYVPIPGMLLSMVINVVTYFFILVNQCILIEDETGFGGVRRSVNIMKHNVFRYFGFMIAIGFIMMVPLLLISQLMVIDTVMYVILIVLIPAIVYFMPLMDVFHTLLFKTVDKSEDMCEKLLINEIE